MPIYQTQRVGRPRLSEDEKKSRLSLTLSKNILASIDSDRGQTPRSTFIESVLQTQKHQSVETREYIRRIGAVYTPPTLADYMAGKVIDHLFEKRKKPSSIYEEVELIKNMRIIDPSCGSGELLNAVWNHLSSRIEGYITHDNIQLRVDPRDILCGIDIDRRAVVGVTLRLESLANAAGFSNKQTNKVLNTNGLVPFNSSSSIAGWERVKRLFSATDGFDVVIANPPWGADVSIYRRKLDQKEFSLLQGQYDTADLFIEMAFSILRKDGFLVFIIPDSLFSMERRHLRKYLLDNSHIHFIARLGEKIFDGINRACAIIVCQKKSPRSDACVKCLRLTPKGRKNILNGTSSFVREEQNLSHLIPQARFLGNPNYAFDIDLNIEEEGILARMSSDSACFDTYLESSRGVELSKRGNVCRCRKCRLWIPMPVTSETRCRHCGAILEEATVNSVTIVSENKSNGAVPFIVGENIDRYNLRQSLWIRQDYEGINYKDASTYKGPKLLVRKTGIGISAAIDYSNAYTNQVVFIFRQRSKGRAQKLPLEFFLGILNSRAMYYFLTKRHGETEWRSHPYVTQSQILSLPLPSKDVFKREAGTIHRIASLLLPYTRRGVEPTARVDASVEGLVASLFGLKKNDYEFIYKTLDSVQDLLPVRKLRRVGIRDIFY